MKDFRQLIDIVEVSGATTIEKFWLNPKTREFISVPDEHDDHTGDDIPDRPFEHGWVRGGFSTYTDCYHLEASSLQEMRDALRYLIKNYTNDYSGLYYDFPQSSGGHLDLENTRKFIRTGNID